MNDPFWLSLSEAVGNWVEALALLVTGLWAVWRFRIFRERETAIDMALTWHCQVTEAADFLTFFDVTLTNRSKVRITAKAQREPSYDDRQKETKYGGEVLRYSGDLLLRPVTGPVHHGDRIRWFPETTATSPQQGDIEADLFEEYEFKEKTDFWMEPGESYHVGTCVALQPGNYLAMLTFVGSKNDREFWRRMFLVHVPGKVETTRTP